MVLSPPTGSTTKTVAAVRSHDNSVSTDADHNRHKVSVYCQSPCEVSINQLLSTAINVEIPLDTSQLTLISENRVLAYGAFLAYGRGGVLAVSHLADS